MWYFLLVIGLIFIDQLTKYIVLSNLDLNQTVPIIENIFHLTYIRNYGAAFSILQGRQIFLAVVTSLLILAVLVILWKKRKTAHPCFLTSLAMIGGGGVGNLIDRIGSAYVVDFLDFRVFPVFNAADIFVTCGCGLLVIYLFIVEPRQQKKKAAIAEIPSVAEDTNEQ